MNFETAKSYLDTLGVNYITEYEYRGKPGEGRERVDLPFFTHVDPSFRPTDWYHIASREGESYIGGCCGNYSAIQDIVSSWFRSNARSIPLNEFEEVVEGMRHHDGEESYFAQDPWTWDIWPEDAGLKDWDSVLAFLTRTHTDPNEGTNWNVLAPWYKLAVLWPLVRDNWTPPQPGAIRRDYDPVDEAIFIVDSMASAVCWHRAFSGIRERDPNGKDKFGRAVAMVRFIPALKVLMDNVRELDFGSFEGLALIDLEKEGEEAICQNGYGYCVYEDRAEAERILGMWRKSWAEREDMKKAPIEERYALRPIRVSIDLPNGFEFSGPAERL